MITRILVPLDGSQQAEGVLPAAVAFAQACKARLSLLHVIEKNAPAEVHDEPHLRDHASAEAYLAALGKTLESQGIAVDYHVHEEPSANAAAGIALHIRELGADFVVMCTHGHRDIRRLIWGSIAQQVAAAGLVPVFFLPPREKQAGGFVCRTILLPLDGNKEHETSVGTALYLARAFGAVVLQVLAVPRPEDSAGGPGVIGRLLPSATGEILNQSALQGKAYLDGMRSRFEEDGLTVSSLLVRGNPQRALPRVIQREKADLVVLGTHGRSGIEAAFEGSVAAAICSRANAPVILVPAEKAP